MGFPQGEKKEKKWKPTINFSGLFYMSVLCCRCVFNYVKDLHNFTYSPYKKRNTAVPSLRLRKLYRPWAEDYQNVATLTLFNYFAHNFEYESFFQKIVFTDIFILFFYAYISFRDHFLYEYICI